MSDIQLLFLILGGLYVWECVCWLRRDGVAFSTWLGCSWQIQYPAAMLGNQTGGFILAPAFPPLGTTLIAFQPPFSLGPDGVLWFVSNNVNPGWRPLQSGRFFSWDDLTKMSLHGKKLRIKNEVLFAAPTSTRAKFLFETLTQLTKLPAGQRAAAIQAFLCAALDGKTRAMRWHDFQTMTAPIRWFTNSLFVLVFIAAPLLITLVGLKLVWLWLVLALLALTITTSVLFVRVHRKFWPAAADERFTHSLIIALAPATAMRALDIAARPLLENHHPLAVAKLFLSAAAFRRFARRVLIDLRHPFQPACPNPQPAAIATEAFFRRAHLETVETWLGENKISPAELCLPLAPADETCRAYCPRCEAQFTAATGTCADCGDLALITFSKVS